MKTIVFLMCVLGSSLAAPALDSGSNEQAAVDNASTALHLMELYRMIGKLQQQAGSAVPAPVDAQSQVLPQEPQQVFIPAPKGDGSDEEDTPFNAFYAHHGSQPAQPAAPLNSDEAEAAEEAEAVEVAEGPEPTEAAPVVDAGTASDITITVAAVDPVADATAAPVAVQPSDIPQEPLVAIETDTTVVGTDATIGAEQVAEATALPVV